MFAFTSSSGGRAGGGIGCLIFGILGLILTYFVLKGVFFLLMWLAPVLFVLALAINWRAVADTGKEFVSLLRRNPLAGLLIGFLGVVGFPVLALFLFLRALGYNKLIAFRQEFGGTAGTAAPKEEEYVEYEELESRPKNAPPEPEEPMELPKPPQKDPEKPGNPYDQLF